MTPLDNKELATCYGNMLEAYLRAPTEASLSRAYEFSRRALVQGCGVLEMADFHHQALCRLATQQPGNETLLTHAERFFAECLSPFEMSHRGAQEGARALRHVNDVLEAELKRIAHALHDEAGQILASIHIAVANLADELEGPPRERLHDIERLLKQIEVDLRNLSHELRPTVLDNLGLVPALEFLAEKITKRSGLAVSVKGETDWRLPVAVETAFYRVVQEALNNAVKHAHASAITIELRHAPDKVACSVNDNGRGFDVDAEASKYGLGLLGIRERLNAFGGSLQVFSNAQYGTALVAEIPLGETYALPRVAGG